MEEPMMLRALRGEPIRILFSEPSQVAQVIVNGLSWGAPKGPIIEIEPPASEEEISTLDVAVDPARRAGSVEVEIQTGSRTFRHFILPNLDLARFRFAFEESEQRLMYCAKCGDWVVRPHGH